MIANPIGILGGTFDPIHLGHIHLASVIKQQCALQSVRILPCNQSPLKNHQPIASPMQRIAMIKLAIAKYDYLMMDDREIQRQGISYMVDTLQSLRAELTKIPLCLIMGIDAFVQFDSWHRWQEIPELVHLIIANRPNAPMLQQNPVITKLFNSRRIDNPELLKTKAAGFILFTDIKPLPIAAIDIRKLIKEHGNASNLLAPTVWQYIVEHKLYL